MLNRLTVLAGLVSLPFVASASLLYLDWDTRLPNGTATRINADSGTIEHYMAQIKHLPNGGRTIQFTHMSSIFDICSDREFVVDEPYDELFTINGIRIQMAAVCRDKTKSGRRDLVYMTATPKNEEDLELVVNAFTKGKNVLVLFPIDTTNGSVDFNAMGFSAAWNK
ncbi:hypothetical protein J4N45_14535 [Vibrio sp. SCSIO 43140]|uniref:hypothetical protein n=1 Tax=Vibrio sp. SCSIO 43140 TaxID=2819100 RepID=UPI002074F2B1|nr:hypothetical protein [Vibrio sp. SCSIO 43140]USD58795.1 hypothetical protein J4N45_09650 [Vibrio sp. SCSIO 43140]USD59129.1 hypothetical protein J4N45_11355 [Vibrio sp. SCSIO 43140]USD59718.1 hypothetical protein J4N45_14535 [Vibrio sp. SCSIO 43140]